MVQVSKKFKTLDKEKLLEEQNKLRKKYGLRPLKRLSQEMVLYCLDDERTQKRGECITPKDGGMYQ